MQPQQRLPDQPLIHESRFVQSAQTLHRIGGELRRVSLAGFAGQRLPGRRPITQTLSQFVSARRSIRDGETARGVSRSDQAVRGAGNDRRRKSRYPSCQRPLPTELSDLTIKERHPIGDAIRLPQILAPAVSRNRGEPSRWLLQLRSVPLQPGNDPIAPPHRQHRLYRHGSMV